MAKARKAARKTRKPAAKRTAKLKGRKVTKSRVAKPKARRAKKQGAIAGALNAIGDAVRLRTRLGGHNRFEDQ